MLQPLLLVLAFTLALLAFGRADTETIADQAPEAPEPRTFMVPMTDGTRLATDVYLPPDTEGPFPVLLARTPYHRSGVLAFAPQALERGFALVAQDCRGRFDSQGTDRAFRDDGWAENRDGADTVEWVAAQTWCDGRIATFGGSALGIVQALMAPTTDRLAAQSMLVAASDFYGQLSYQGGVFRKSLVEKWSEGQGSSYIVDDWHAHPADGPFWDGFDADARAADITAPGLHIGGWWDIFQQGTLDHFVARQRRGGPGAEGNQKLIMGPWPHGIVQQVGELRLPDNFGFDIHGYERRFLDHWVLGEDNGITDEPAVHYYTLGDVNRSEGPGNEWRTAACWPPFETVPMAWHLRSDGRLTREPPHARSSITYTHDPADPSPTLGGQNLMIPAGSFDQRPLADRHDVLVFLSEPLDAPKEFTGRFAVRLFVSSNAPDTDFTARLVDVYPNGRHMLLLDGVQRLKFRKGFRKAEPLTPGRVGELSIDLWSLSWVVDTGHRIGLYISSSNYPRFELNPNSGDDFPTDTNLRPARNTIHMSPDHPSALVLPFRPAGGP